MEEQNVAVTMPADVLREARHLAVRQGYRDAVDSGAGAIGRRPASMRAR